MAAVFVPPPSTPPGLPQWLDGKESACDVGAAGDVGTIPGEDPLEEGMASYSNILPWRRQGQRSLAGYSPCGHKGSDTSEVT